MVKIKKISGVILSGGKSRRMKGGDKAFIKLGNKTLLERSIERLDKQVDALAVNTNSKNTQYHKYGIPILNDIKSGYLGPLAGVLTAMKWAEEIGCENVITVAVDTPFFPSNLTEIMKKKMDNYQAEIVLACSFSEVEKRFVVHPVFGLWSSSLAEDLNRSLERGTRKVLDWVVCHRVQYVNFLQEKIDPFFNINQKEDLDSLSKLGNMKI